MGLRLQHSTDRVFHNRRWRQSFTIHRRVRAANDKGRAESTEVVIRAAGEIQPTSGADLDRLQEGDRGKASVTVWTPTPLTVGTEHCSPDEIEYRGVRYLVIQARDWMDYGRGFCRAVCVAQEMAAIAGGGDSASGGDPP